MQLASIFTALNGPFEVNGGYLEFIAFAKPLLLERFHEIVVNNVTKGQSIDNDIYGHLKIDKFRNEWGHKLNYWRDGWLTIYITSLVGPGRRGGNISSVFSKLIFALISRALPVKFGSGECHRNPFHVNIGLDNGLYPRQCWLRSMSPYDNPCHNVLMQVYFINIVLNLLLFRFKQCLQPWASC